MILVKVMSTPVDDIEVEEGLEVGEELNLTPDPLPEVGNSKWEVLFEHHIHINSTATKTTKVKALNSFFFFFFFFLSFHFQITTGNLLFHLRIST